MKKMEKISLLAQKTLASMLSTGGLSPGLWQMTPGAQVLTP
jgi:hypothetical protein